MAHALALHGDSVYETLDERERRIAAKVFQYLSGEEGGGRIVSHPARIEEIAEPRAADDATVCDLSGE